MDVSLSNHDEDTENEITNIPIVKCDISKEKSIIKDIFCPETMNIIHTSNKDYKIIWQCKICLKFVLKEDVLQNHIIKCEKELKTNAIQLNKHEICDSKKSEVVIRNKSLASTYFSLSLLIFVAAWAYFISIH